MCQQGAGVKFGGGEIAEVLRMNVHGMSLFAISN
jgi:hypothetical protein